MKKTFILFALLLFFGSSFAQISVIDGSGNPVTDGSEFIYNVTGEDAGLSLAVTNTVGTAIDLYLECNELFGTDGSQFEHCFDVCRFGIEAGNPYGPLTIDAGATTTNGQVHFVNHDNSADYMSYNLTIYEDGNTGNSVTFTYIYDLNASSTNDMDKNGLRVYPNPAKDYFILTSEQRNIESYTLIDLSGRTVLSSTYNTNGQMISTETIENGIYFLKVNFRNTNTAEIHKLIVQ